MMLMIIQKSFPQMYYLDQYFPELELLKNTVMIAGLFIGVFVLGVIITWISTFIATQRLRSTI